jgi:hypothetical protein
VSLLQAKYLLDAVAVGRGEVGQENESETAIDLAEVMRL